MPARYFPFSQDFNSDAEGWELTETFGDRSMRIWTEILGIMDRNHNLWKLVPGWENVIAAKVRQKPPTVQSVVGWMLAKGWLVTDQPVSSGLPEVVRLRNYAKYRKIAAEATPSPSPTSPSSPTIKKNPKKDSSLRSPSAQAIEAAQLLSDLIFDNFPNRTAPTESQLVSWAHDADRLNRIDGHDFNEIKEMIRWAQRDSFWRGPIQSMQKVRKHWNQLIAKKETLNGKENHDDETARQIAKFRAYHKDAT